jgi:hypothetical protein
MEEMLDDLSRAMQAADDKVQEWQAKIKKRDCFWQETEYGFNIYGEVREDAYNEEHLIYYRFCKCYSSACPEGEMGDIHLSVISGILTREEFGKRIQELQ